MFTPEKLTDNEFQPLEVMRERTLAYLGLRLAAAAYPGYPAERLHVSQQQLDEMLDTKGILHLPEGPWSTKPTLALPSAEQIGEFAEKQLRFDNQNRPLHPWINEMLVRPDIGVVTGHGFYWHWGPNQAADPIVTAEDTGAILLIKRADTHQWALPGGFIDPGEDALNTALRELHEEANIDVEAVPEATIRQSYQGPVADIRTAANAWAETTSFDIRVPTELPCQATDPEEVEAVAWVPRDKINEQLKFGSHSLLVELALRQIEG